MFVTILLSFPDRFATEFIRLNRTVYDYIAGIIGKLMVVVDEDMTAGKYNRAVFTEMPSGPCPLQKLFIGIIINWPS